ncbi:hypothetical protein HOP50_06g44700 [Chloropicon primus]|uniref:Coiled-coil domain-containing protein 86 n=1 Tax=Chloropicon primus TaxID=1764295 RepID=A0A5B8MN76_9CHLO|nr:hypothetical protein A3770_06p44470 [Chloropicon primus]UPR01149.1 hypothetical protein HOP50_06g44700 [Chloropicon primus]|eukprot:QDZ21929.1 hypothetical protein A3770_06p44470 [Chloropicon primus]
MEAEGERGGGGASGSRFEEGSYVPEQYDPMENESQHDFRSLEDRGSKEKMGWRVQTRKRRREEFAQKEKERPAVEAVQDTTTKKIRTSSTVGKESGRSWKHKNTSRSSSQNQSMPKASWDEKMRKKRELASWKQQRNALKEEVKEAHRAERQRREEKRKLKEENSKRTGIVYQKISNPRKLRNMSKKQFKNVVLRTADLPKSK